MSFPRGSVYSLKMHNVHRRNKPSCAQVQQIHGATSFIKITHGLKEERKSNKGQYNDNIIRWIITKPECHYQQRFLCRHQEAIHAIKETSEQVIASHSDVLLYSKSGGVAISIMALKKLCLQILSYLFRAT